MHPALSTAEIERLAMEHEQAVNPVTAMPGAAETLRELSSRGVMLGLVSNAQFYTVPVLEACLGGSLADFGIDPELLPHIFEPFRQAQQNSDRSLGGLGLGLSLVRGLITLHGGSVRAESAGDGGGSVFVIELPLSHESGPPTTLCANQRYATCWTAWPPSAPAAISISTLRKLWKRRPRHARHG